VQPPLSDAETNEVLATMKSFHTFAGLKIYDNFRCNAYTDDDSHQNVSRCEYVIPVKRINVLPDEVELVFLDGDREVSNPAYGIYLAGLLQAGVVRWVCRTLCAPAHQERRSTDASPGSSVISSIQAARNALDKSSVL
jgi:hypothetical protein